MISPMDLDQTGEQPTVHEVTDPKEPPALPKNEWAEVRSTPSAGLGLFALRDIPPGTSILIEKPLLIRERNGSRVDLHYDFLDLNAETRRTLMSLHANLEVSKAAVNNWVLRLQRHLLKSFPSSRYSDEDRVAHVRDLVKVRNIFYTNRYEYHDRYAVFVPLTSRINHACNANAAANLDRKLRDIQVKNARPVQTGEQICLDYSCGMEDWQERNKYLMKLWAFECACEICEAARSKKQDLPS